MPNRNEYETPAKKLHELMPTLHSQNRIGASSEHAVGKGEATATASAENKITTHLGRLAKLLDERGSSVEKRVWDSAIDELIIAPDDIPQSYWELQEKLARDNGRGDVRIDDYLKTQLTEQLQDAQRTGIESWATYLQQTGDQYPLWFKFYVWDGMSKLGTFDKPKGHFNKRSQGTIAPYPQLNPAVLSKVYGAVQDSFNGKSPEDPAIQKLLNSGNFNKLYSHFLLDQKAIIPTPEKSEDVKGEWTHYTSSDIQAIAHATEGTPWCIAGEDMAHEYTNSGGSFYLFHLEDPETRYVSPTACASIRIDGDGNVVELSGLEGGSSQYIEDALVPTVMEKVKTLPDGERFLTAFEDKQTLIEMDQKFQEGKLFSIEELRFLYELDRKIEYIDTYAHDLRPDEFKTLKDTHQEQLALEYGVSNAEWMVMDSYGIALNHIKFLMAGVAVEKLVDKMCDMHIAYCLPRLLDAGATIDVSGLISRLRSEDIAYNIDQLLEAGVAPDIILGKLNSDDIKSNLTDLVDGGVEPDMIIANMLPMHVVSMLPYLLKAGANIDVDSLVSSLDPYSIVGNLRQLVSAGVDANSLVAKVNGNNLHGYLRQLLEVGATVDVIVSAMDDNQIAEELTQLLEAGAVVDTLVARMNPTQVGTKLTQLLEAGATLDTLVAKLSPIGILNNIKQLMEAGATIDFDALVSEAGPNAFLYRDELKEVGYNITDHHRLPLSLR